MFPTPTLTVLRQADPGNGGSPADGSQRCHPRIRPRRSHTLSDIRTGYGRVPKS